MQVAMSTKWTTSDPATASSSPVVHQPIAVLGLEGIYDLPALVKYNSAIQVYRTFTTSAFGADEKVWADVSPTSGQYASSWKDGRLIVLAHSREDELVEWEQVDLMAASLERQGLRKVDVAAGRLAENTSFGVLELKGKHHEVWEQGDEVTRAIVTCVDMLT